MEYSELVKFGQLAVSSEYFTFMPGMQVIEVNNECRSRLAYFNNYWNAYDGLAFMRYRDMENKIPDFSDPCTLGCLTFFVRKKFEDNRGQDGIATAFQIDGYWGVGSMEQNIFAAIVLPVYQTEIEALVVALTKPLS